MTSVATVAEALRRLAEAPDWVVLDLMLPDGDGVEVLRVIRAHGIATRVAITTGCGDPARLEAAVSFRPELLMKKPIEVATLLAHLAS